MRYNDLRKLINEHNGEKTAAIVYASLNPITPQEERIINEAKDWARRNGADVVLYSPKHHDPKRNPLEFDTKKAAVRKIFGLNLESADCVFEALSKTQSSQYTNGRAFFTEDVKCPSGLLESFGYEMDSISIVGNEESREMILAGLHENVYIGKDYGEDYANSLKKGARFALYETYTEYKPQIPFFSKDDVVKNTTNGDIAVVIKSGNRVFCESCLTRTPEFYDPNDLVLCDKQLAESVVGTYKPYDIDHLMEHIDKSGFID